MSNLAIEPEEILLVVLIAAVLVVAIPGIPPQIGVFVLIWGSLILFTISFLLGVILGIGNGEPVENNEKKESVTTTEDVIEDVHERYFEGELDDIEFEKELERVMELEED